jgi:general secretion pathway protein A
MVLDYYKLREQPFGATPGSRCLFLSATHREALASLLYGIESGCGFVAMIAKPGLGKTTLLFQLMNHLRDKATTVFLFQTITSSADLLKAILTDLGVDQMPSSLFEMQVRLNKHLIEQARLGKRVVVVIDEAQNLGDSVLELVRMLSNFESSHQKLIQIILSGQPQLAEKLASPRLVQLGQRVSIFAFLEPLSSQDTKLYIDHRLRTAGYAFEVPLFTREALALIAQFSGGTPRNINNLCFNALSLGCAAKQKTINADTIREVVADRDLDRLRKEDHLGVQPGERGFSVLLSTASAPPLLANWLPKLGLAAVVMVVLGWSLFASHRRLAPTVSAQTNRSASQPYAAGGYSSGSTEEPQRMAAVPDRVQADGAGAPIVPAAISSSSEIQNPSRGTTGGAIRVTPGRTLLGICAENFGTCNPEILQEIRKLNPRLGNPDHIESGKTILIPPFGRDTSTKEQSGKTSIAKKDMK